VRHRGYALARLVLHLPMPTKPRPAAKRTTPDGSGTEDVAGGVEVTLRLSEPLGVLFEKSLIVPATLLAGGVY